MEPIKFYIGQESGIVVENKDFATSIFAEQYKQTFEILNHIWKAQEKQLSDEKNRVHRGSGLQNVSNIISFCGDRGEGKTSVLTTVREILCNKEAHVKAEQELGIKLPAPAERIKALKLIDPLYFDSEHNLLELLLGQMMEELQSVEQGRACDTDYQLGHVELKNDLIRSFQKVQDCLSLLNLKMEKTPYDELENLDDLAASTKLYKELDCLFSLYIRFFNVDKLIISIDDLDLNMDGGDKMAEEMRKYLCSSSYCILLVALKVDQLERIIMSTMRERLQTIINNDVIKDMARKYVVKLLPLGNRVQMPLGVDVAEKELVISDNGHETKPLVVKEFVVRLIFQKTRFIFVNGRSLCPIVPTNLRELRHLIGELWNLPDATKDEKIENVANKNIFKHYFYETWIKCLDEEFQNATKTIILSKDVVATNKCVLSYFTTISKLNDCVRLAKDLSPLQNKDLIQEILNPKNMDYHVSVGDVYYILQNIESVAVDVNIKNFIFFLKAYYSIRLYEIYDIISFDENHLSPMNIDQTPSIYRFEEDIKKENLLQRFVNGSYFTYYPSDVLPSENIGKTPRDRRVINLGQLLADLASLKARENENQDKESSQEYIRTLNRCEYFALTSLYTLYRKETNMVILDRTKYGPVYVPAFETSKNYLVFDVLSIFYNIINVKLTYHRFDELFGGDFYQFAINNEYSLLRQILRKFNNFYNGDSELDASMHGLISDAIIRFSEVQQSIIETLKQKKNQLSKSGNLKNLESVYSYIQKIDIKLYPLIDDTYRHTIEFKFLSPIIQYLQNEDESNFNTVYGPNAFEESLNNELLINECNLIFANSLMSENVVYPKTGAYLRRMLAKNDTALYDRLGAEFWRRTILSNKRYNNFNDVLEDLSPYISDIIYVYNTLPHNN